jgi:hypothetical protein
MIVTGREWINGPTFVCPMYDWDAALVETCLWRYW